MEEGVEEEMNCVCWYLTGRRTGELVDRIREVEPDAWIVMKGDMLVVPLGRYDYDSEPEDSPRSLMEDRLRSDDRLRELYLEAYCDVTTEGREPNWERM